MINNRAVKSINEYGYFWLRCMPSIFMMASSIGLMKLGTMQLEGVPTIGGFILTFLYAFCALIYTRAQTVEIDKKQALIAADQCLSASLIATLTFVVIYWGFLILSESYKPYAGNPLKPLPGEDLPFFPVAVAFIIFIVLVLPIFMKLTIAISFTVKNMSDHFNSLPDE